MVNGVVMMVPTPIWVIITRVPVKWIVPPPRTVPSVMPVPMVIIPTVRTVETVPRIGVNVYKFGIVGTADNRYSRGMEAYDAIGECPFFLFSSVERQRVALAR